MKTANLKEKKTEELIYNSNDLIQNYRHSLTLQEQRIFCLLLSGIQRYDTDFYWQEYTLEGLAKAIGITMGGNTRKSIDDAVLSLGKKRFLCKLGGKKNPKILVGFLDAGCYIDDSIVRLKLCHSLKPFLLGRYDSQGQVIKPFTVYALQLVSRFRSRYSLPLYEYVRSMQHKQRHWSTVLTVMDCKDLLGTKQDVPWCNFNKNALSVAIADINRVSDITIDTEYQKKGKTIVAVRLICHKKSGYKLGDYLKESASSTEVVELDTLLAAPSDYDEEDDVIDPEALCDQPPDVEDEAFFAACLVDVDVD